MKLWRALVCLVCVLFSTTAWSYQRVTMDDLPAPVMETLTRETRNAMIDDILRETRGGKMVYVVKYMKAGIRWQLDIEGSGAMLGRRRD
jgi:hypothetical protein